MKRQLSFEDLERGQKKAVGSRKDVAVTEGGVSRQDARGARVLEPEITEDESFGADEGLPEGWTATTIGKLATLVTGKTPPTRRPELFGGSILFVRPGDLEVGSIIEKTETTITHAGLATVPRLPAGTVLVSCIGRLGKAALLPAEGSCNQQINAVLPNAALEPRFTLYWARTLRAWLEENASATTVPILNKGRFSRAPIALPPLVEQRRIVDKLDALSERSVRAREALDEVPGLLEKLRQSILAAAFRGDLTAEWRTSNPQVEPAGELVARTPVPTGKSTGRAASKSVQPGRYAVAVGNPNSPTPDGWAWVPLSRVAQMGSGHTPSRERPTYWNGDIPWIGIADAREHHGRVINTTLQSVTEEGLANSAARLLPAMTVCLSRTASVGYVTIMGRSMATSQDFANWSCTEALLPKYLMYALLAEGDGLRNFGEGSTHTTIYFPELKALHICLAPLEEQRRIVELIEARLAVVAAIAKVVADAREAHSTIDRSLLAKAFRGELVPQDPNDEPAAVMLARLREERAAATEMKTGVRKKRTARTRRGKG